MTKDNEFIIRDEIMPEYLDPEKQKEQDEQRQKEMKEFEKFVDRQ